MAAINKRAEDIGDALSGVADEATVLIGGFGAAGSPIELIHGLIDAGVGGLTVVSNNTGAGNIGLAALIRERRVAKVICSYPRSAGSEVFPELYRQGEIELEVVPQGTLAERIRAGGAGVPAFFTPTGAGTELAEGKEQRQFNGRTCLLEMAITADLALIQADVADEHGNLLYNKTARNFGPVMATAAQVTVAQARTIVAPGGIDPEQVVTPGIFVQRVVEVAQPADEARLVAQGAWYP